MTKLTGLLKMGLLTMMIGFYGCRNAGSMANDNSAYASESKTFENNGSVSQTKSNAQSVTIPDVINEIPESYFNDSDQPGTLADLYYDTWESFTYEEQGERLTKHAIVYLPYGYDENQQYDVFYLMHGGWNNENTTLGTADQPGVFKNVIDHAIANGEIRPLIIVCPTYNNTNVNGQDSDNFSLALRLTDQFHNELRN